MSWAVALLASIAGVGARAAEWQLQPSSDLYAYGESNPRLLLGSTPYTESAVADVTLDLDRKSETLDVDALSHLQIHRYSEDVGLNRDEGGLVITLKQQGERVSWLGSATLVRDTTISSELGTTGLSQYNLRHQSVQFSLGPTWQITERFSTGGTLSWLDSTYPGNVLRTGLVDTAYRTASGNAGYAITENAQLSLVASAGQLDAGPTDLRTRDNSVVLQTRYQWSPRWTLTAFAGPSWVRSTQSSDHGERYNLNLSRQHSERTVVSLLLDRTVAPTGNGLLSQRDDISVQLGEALTERLDAAISYSLIHSRDLIPAYGFSFNDVRYHSAQASLSWRLAEHWSAVLGAGSSDQRASALASGTARNNFARLAIAWTGHAHVN
jgi:hypothetical protein